MKIRVTTTVEVNEDALAGLAHTLGEKKVLGKDMRSWLEKGIEREVKNLELEGASVQVEARRAKLAELEARMNAIKDSLVKAEEVSGEAA